MCLNKERNFIIGKKLLLISVMKNVQTVLEWRQSTRDYLLAKVSAKQDEKKAKKMLRSVREFSGTIVLILLWHPVCHTYLIGLPLQLPCLPCVVYRSSGRSRNLSFSLMPASFSLPQLICHPSHPPVTLLPCVQEIIPLVLSVSSVEINEVLRID